MLVPSLSQEDALEEEVATQHSCLENPMDRRAWWATVHGVEKTRTQLSTHGPEALKNIQQDRKREQGSNGGARGGMGWAGPSSKMLEAMPAI